MANLKCPICLQQSIKDKKVTKGDYEDYTCNICGQFKISGDTETILKNNPPDYRLSAWIREHQEEPPKITTYLLDDVLKNLPNYKVSEKQTLLLRAIERRTDYPGAVVTMAKEDYPLAWTKNYEELIFILRSLGERGFIYTREDELNVGIVQTKILPQGWEYLDKH